MFDAFAKALQQMPDPAFRKVLIKSISLTIVVFVVLLGLAYYLVVPLIVVDISWLDWLSELAGILVFLVAAFLLFPAVATLFVSLFLEEIASAVERRHYPDSAPGQSPDAMTSFLLSLRFTVIAILLNILALPVYILGLLFPPLNIVVFYGLNGYLLSREYFELVSSRHLAPEAMHRLRKSAGRRLWLSGVLIAFLLTIPFVNLIAPLLATAAMIHIFKNVQARHIS